MEMKEKWACVACEYFCCSLKRSTLMKTFIGRKAMLECRPYDKLIINACAYWNFPDLMEEIDIECIQSPYALLHENYSAKAKQGKYLGDLA